MTMGNEQTNAGQPVDGEQIIAEVMDQLRYSTRRAGEFRALARGYERRVAELEQENHELKKQLEEKQAPARKDASSKTD
jgi:Skp family chaperone for outer membrane proteins